MFFVFGKKSCQPSPDLRGVFEIIKHDNSDTIVNSLSVNESSDSVGQVVVSATRIVSEGNAETHRMISLHGAQKQWQRRLHLFRRFT